MALELLAQIYAGVKVGFHLPRFRQVSTPKMLSGMFQPSSPATPRAAPLLIATHPFHSQVARPTGAHLNPLLNRFLPPSKLKGGQKGPHKSLFLVKPL